MRIGFAVVLALGAVLAGRCPALASEEFDTPTSGEMLSEQLEALDDLEHAATDEEARAAEERFDAAAVREMQRRRESLIELIER